MKIYIERIIIKNFAPFENLDLVFKQNEIAVLTAVNGRGKTTILSYIVDAWHELLRPHFNNEFKGKEDSYYRFSSAAHVLDTTKPAFVYIRFRINDAFVDYLNIRGKCSEQQYAEVVKLNDRIPFEQFGKLLEQEDCVKTTFPIEKKKIEEVINKNVITYFPAYRYEKPGYLNDPYEIHLDFKKKSPFSGNLPNPLEVVTGLPQLANWIMDVVLDGLVNKPKVSPAESNPRVTVSIEMNGLIKNLNQLISQTLQPKINTQCRLGIGRRNAGSARISINSGDQLIYPSIFDLSSGETAMFCLFGEILRQADILKTNVPLNEIQGIVLIDEVDKHLHIKLQKEILSKLFALFPNVQFIISSHSPFLNMGLAEIAKERSRIVDLDHGGIDAVLEKNDQYLEVYNMMTQDNARYAQQYQSLRDKLVTSTKPLIITEGKTDIKHLKRAKEKLGISIDIEFWEAPDEWGSSKLETLLENLSKIPNQRRIIGIFDRDEPKYLEHFLSDGKVQYKVLGNNVFAFAIPKVNSDIYGVETISIEHYYAPVILSRADKNGRRLFLGKEFLASSGNSKDGAFQTKIKGIQNKVEVNGVIDDKVYRRDDLEQKTNVALTKDDFATMILEDTGIIDFSRFRGIFSILEQIIKLP